MNELITDSPPSSVDVTPSSVDVANAWLTLEAEGLKLKKLRAEILVQYEPAPVSHLNIALLAGGGFAIVTGLVFGTADMAALVVNGVTQDLMDPLAVIAGGVWAMLPAGFSLAYGEKFWGRIMKSLNPKKYRAKEARKELDEKILPYLLQDFMNKTEEARAVIANNHPNWLLVMDRCVFTIANKDVDSSRLNQIKQGIGTARIILEADPPATVGGISYTDILKELES